MAEDTKSVGTTLEYGSSPTQIVHVTSFGGPSHEVGDIETTDYEVSDDYKTYIPGMIDAGELELGIKYDKSEHSANLNQIAVKQDFTITFNEPDLNTPSTLDFTGYVKGFAYEFADSADDGLVQNTITIKVSGKPTFTEGS